MKTSEENIMDEQKFYYTVPGKYCNLCKCSIREEYFKLRSNLIYCNSCDSTIRHYNSKQRSEVKRKVTPEDFDNFAFLIKSKIGAVVDDLIAKDIFRAEENQQELGVDILEEASYRVKCLKGILCK